VRKPGSQNGAWFRENEIGEAIMYIEIIYYTKHLGNIRTCRNILNTTDKLQTLVVRKMDAYWQKPGVTRYMHTYVHAAEVINLV
jgi:hypothetical protein